MDFINSLVALPTVLFTVPVGVSMLYWLMVIVGAADLDGVFSSGDGVAEGGGEAVGEGMLESGGEAIGEGAVADGVVDGVGHIEHGGETLLHGAAEAGMLASLFRLGKVPLTITITVVSLLSWVASGVTMSIVRDAIPAGLVGLAMKLGVGLGAFTFATLLARILTSPLQRLNFKSEPTGAAQLIGKKAVLISARLTGKGGQAELTSGDANLLLQVRSAVTNNLGRGDEVLIIAWDEASGFYEVEPYAALMQELDEDVAPRRAAVRADEKRNTGFGHPAAAAERAAAAVEPETEE